MKMLNLIAAAVLALTLAGRLAASTPTVYGPTTFTAAADTLTSYAEKAEVATLQIADVTGTAGVQLEGTLDGGTWATLMLSKAGTATVSLTATANGIYQANIAGMVKVRAKALYVASGVARVQLSVSTGQTNVQAVVQTTPTP